MARMKAAVNLQLKEAAELLELRLGDHIMQGTFLLSYDTPGDDALSEMRSAVYTGPLQSFHFTASPSSEDL